MLHRSIFQGTARKSSALFYRIFRLAVLLLWILMVVLLVRRDILIPEDDQTTSLILERSRQEQYYGIWRNSRRIGYAYERLAPESGETFTLEQHSVLNLTILDSPQTIRMNLRGRLDKQLRLLDFSFSFSSQFSSIQATGSMRGNALHYRLDTGQAVIRDAIRLQQVPRLPLNRRPWLRSQLSSPGDRVRISHFDPMTLQNSKTIITYHGLEKQLINGTVHTLHHYTQKLAGLTSDLYTDDQGKVIKEVSATGFTLLAEPKYKALDIQEDRSGLLADMAVSFSGTLASSHDAQACYILELPETWRERLDGGRQTLTDGVLVIRREELPGMDPNGSGSTVQRDVEVSCADDSYLQATAHVQADHPRIRETAGSVLGETSDPAKQVRLLASFVYNHLKKRPVIGLPDALTTLESGKGDCNEHATLFTALARAAGLPAQTVFGVTLHRGKFYYHAWNEVCLQDRWLSLDTTVNQIPADLYHIRLGRGDIEEQLKIGSLLGNVAIKAVPCPASGTGNAPAATQRK